MCVRCVVRFAVLFFIEKVLMERNYGKKRLNIDLDCCLELHFVELGEFLLLEYFVAPDFQ